MFRTSALQLAAVHTVDAVGHRVFASAPVGVREAVGSTRSMGSASSQHFGKVHPISGVPGASTDPRTAPVHTNPVAKEAGQNPKSQPVPDFANRAVFGAAPKAATSPVLTR